MSLGWLLWWGVRMRSRAVRTICKVAFLVPLVLAVLIILLVVPRRLQIKHKVPMHQKLVMRQVQQASPVSASELSGVSTRPWFMRGGTRRPQSHNLHAKIFLDDTVPGDDRIIEQLMYTFPTDKVLPLKKIYLPNGLNEWRVAPGREKFLSNKCPVDHCWLTDKRRDIASADAILFKDRFVPLHHERDPKQIWIIHFLENPYNTPKEPWLRSRENNEMTFDLFNWTATYRRDSDIVTPYGKFVYYNPNITERELKVNYAANKTKKVAMFVSNCWASNQRLEYAKKLASYIQVDIFGNCDKGLQCRRTDPKCMQKLNTEYKFYLAFENANCQNYITEKLFLNGFNHDVIPIVMGARPSDYAEVAPPGSYLHVEEFADPKELAAYLHILDKNDTLYNSYFKWKGTGEFINTYFFCRVCAMLHASAERNHTSQYSDVNTWWREDTCTTKEWRHTTYTSQNIFFYVNSR